MKLIRFILFGVWSLNLNAQLTVDNTISPTQLVDNFISGTGIGVSNVSYSCYTYDGIYVSIGSFLATNSNLGFNTGIILGTGDVTWAIGPNDATGDGDWWTDASDPDLNIICDDDTYDATVLEFDFIPQSDSISFSYIFASEEYMEFVNASYNDGFGFFLSGPGITGSFSNNAINIALIPGTNEFVSIDNLNENEQGVFYVNNEIPVGQTIEYDGFTKPLKAKAAVQCGQTYHLKIAIADAHDGVYDSGVFLMANSFTSSSSGIDFTFEGTDTSHILIEACTETALVISRSDISSALNLNLEISGTASNGIDYSPIPTTINFEVGQDSMVLDFETLADNLAEGNETLTLSLTFVNSCGDSIFVSKTYTIKDPFEIDSLTSTATIGCEASNGSISAFISNTTNAPNYTWRDATGQIVGTTSQVLNLPSSWYYLEVVDGSCALYDSVFISNTGGPSAEFSIDKLITTAPANITFINLSQNATSYYWNFGNGLDSLIDTSSDISSTYNENTSYNVILVAYQGSCSDTASLLIEFLSEPSVFEPNIFTPNTNDQINSVFTLAPKNFSEFHFTIFNRWGNIMFEGDLNANFWDGKLATGELANEATYFYKYEGKGFNNQVKNGHGFFLLKNK